MLLDAVSGLAKSLWPFGSCDDDIDASRAMGELVANLHYEIIPMASVAQAIADLPAGSSVSVTCSPANGIGATQEITGRLLAEGHRAIPHLAARMVESAGHAAELAVWARTVGLDEVFVIAGDAPEPHGPYEGAHAFLVDFLAADPGLSRVGVAGYPDGHPFVEGTVVDAQLLAKQALLADHGLGGWISTQMCFDPDTIRTWLDRERRRGIVLPVRLGVPGVVDRAQLMRVGTRLGIGASLRFLSKNTATVMRLLAPGGYDPTEMVETFADDAERLGIEALHSFTFNAVADTRRWQEAILHDAVAI